MREIFVGQEKVVIDHDILKFGEANLNEFLQKIGTYNAYFAEKQADSVWILGLYEQKHEEIYSRRFRELKGTGKSVSNELAEAAAKTDTDVIEAHHKMLAARLNKDLLTGFLKSIDKAFQAAMNYGYNRRKEMDKLNHDIYGQPLDDPNERMAEVLAQDSL